MKIIQLGWNMEGKDGFKCSCDYNEKKKYIRYCTSLSTFKTTIIIKWTRAIWIFGVKIK